MNFNIRRKLNIFFNILGRLVLEMLLEILSLVPENWFLSLSGCVLKDFWVFFGTVLNLVNRCSQHCSLSGAFGTWSLDLCPHGGRVRFLQLLDCGKDSTRRSSWQFEPQRFCKDQKGGYTMTFLKYKYLGKNTHSLVWQRPTIFKHLWKQTGRR